MHGQPPQGYFQPPPRRGLGCGGVAGIGLALLVTVGLVSWIRGARESRAVATDASAPVSSTEPPAASSAAPPAPDGHLRDAFAIASFKDDVLDECVDWEIEIVPAADASVAPDASAAAFADLRKAVAKKGGTPIEGNCDATFSDRDVLAACTATKTEKGKNGGEVRMKLGAGYYDFGTVGFSDAYRRDCLQMGGKWFVQAPDSEVWRRAKLEHSRRKLEKLTK